MKKLLLASVSVLALGGLFAAGAEKAVASDVNRSDPNFVTVSLVVSEPANSLYSAFGHVCLRMQCPTFELDNIFTEESEAVENRVLTFFAGKLKMGMFAVRTEEFLKQYEQDGRGTRQYRLNLPPEVKQRLWKVLDDRVAEGHDQPYDYEKRGCVRVIVSCLLDALGSEELELPPWTAEYDLTRREIAVRALEQFKWFRFFIHAIWGTEIDREKPKIEKIVTPAVLLSFLKKARIRGMPVISEEFKQLVPPSRNPMRPTVFTPMMVAILLVFVSIANLFIKKTYFDWLFLGMQSLAGVFFCYLVCFSSLPATDWNWLVVPFNVLPFVFWRWRRYWVRAFAVVLIAWEVLMIFYPHQLTDWAYVVIVFAYIVFYGKLSGRSPK